MNISLRLFGSFDSPFSSKGVQFAEYPGGIRFYGPREGGRAMEQLEIGRKTDGGRIAGGQGELLHCATALPRGTHRSPR